MTLVKNLPFQYIKFKHAINKRDSMEIHPDIIYDHRKLARFPDSGKEHYCTYSIPEDKTLRMVLRDIPLSVELLEVDLRENGFTVCKISWFNTKNVEGQKLFGFLDLPRNEDNKEIYNIRQPTSSNSSFRPMTIPDDIDGEENVNETYDNIIN